eukprot:236085_1
MDYFNVCGKKQKINEQKDTLTGTAINDNSCYGYRSIPSTSTSIHKWTFKIGDIPKNIIGFGTISIGIDEDKNNKWINSAFWKEKKTHNYSYHSQKGKINCGADNEDVFRRYGKHDSICMVLDLCSSNKSLYFMKNGVHKVANMSVKTGLYKMCVYTEYKGTTVKLLSYSCIDNKNDDNNINDDMKSSKRDMTDKAKIDDVKSENESNLNAVLKQNDKLQQEIQHLKRENGRLQLTSSHKMEQFKVQIEELQNEKKEMEFTIKELQKENKKLKESKPLNYSKWIEWDSNEIYKFIMNIFSDNRLEEYKDDIYQEIIESEYSGQHLLDLDITDIKNMGIKKSE